MNVGAKKIVFPSRLCPSGQFWDTNAHCTYLQIAQANPQTKIYKRVQFLQTQIVYLYS